MWDPYKGLGYKEGGVLLLGESCYDWLNDGVMNFPQADHPSMIVNESKLAPAEGAKTMRKLTRALARCATPSPEEASAGWDRVAFTNYIPVSVGHGANMPKRSPMWRQALDEWPTVLDLLNPGVVIVLGLTMWHRMPTTQSIVNDKVQGYRLPNGAIAMCHAHPHPAFGPPWKYYADAVDEAFKAAA